MKVCLVTGALRGIGSAIARRLAALGNVVYLNYKQDDSAAMQLCQEIRAVGGQAEPGRADVASRAEVRHLFDEIKARQGRLDVLVHNAAAVLVPKPLSRLDWSDDIMPQMEVACRGFLNCIQEAMPLLPAGGRVVVLLTDALVHKPPVQMGAYLAAKGALFGLARAAAKELERRNISLNMVSPSMTRTDLLKNYGERAVELFAQDHVLGRLAEPDEVAEAVVFLATSTSQYLRGINLPLTGGQEF